MSFINKIKTLFKVAPTEQEETSTSVKDKTDMFEQHIKDSFMDIERKFIGQQEKFKIRVFDDEHLNITSFLERTLDIKAKEVKTLQVITDDWLGKEWHNVTDIANYDMLFSDYVSKSDKEGIVMQGGNARNIIFHVMYERDGKDLNLFMHYRGYGFHGNDGFMGIPVSIIFQNIETGLYDPYLVYMTFGVRKSQVRIDEIAVHRVTAIEKANQNKELTRDEMYLLVGTKTIDICLFYANKRMEEERWGDATSDLIEAYKMLREEWFCGRLDDKGVSLFHETCYKLGYCYYKVKLYKKALYFLEIANGGETNIERKKTYFHCLVDACDINAANIMTYEQYLMSKTDSYQKAGYSKKEINDFDMEIFSFIKEYIQKMGVTDTNLLLQNSKIGVLLNAVFDIHPSEISNMLVLSGSEKIEEISNQTQIWNYDFIGKSESRKEFTAYISYRTYRDCVSEEFLDPNKDYAMPKGAPNEKLKMEIPYASIDKSKCRIDNDIIIHCERQDDVALVTVMIPQFQLSDNNNKGIPKTVSVKYRVDASLSHEEFENMRAVAVEKYDKKEELKEEEFWALGKQPKAHELFILGMRAFRSKYWGDAIYYFTKAYTELAHAWSKDNIDEFDKAMLGEICNKLGYSYSELKQYELSIYYLLKTYETGRFDYTMELINSMVNGKDTRVYSLISSEINRLSHSEYYKNLSDKERNFYLAFLNRRYGYVLIEMHEWDKAKEHFHNLLEDPDCHDFAKGELEYLNSLGLS